MAKRKFLEDIKARPGRFYRVPGDVMRDRRFGDFERLEILRAWAAEGDPELAGQINDALADMERRLATSGHAAE
ncbi:MAG TPA: hypothetical protein VN935_04970 [Rhizomicrobium sp.]|jgi:hypothetical protein|nr:hypothetical protein [Rhizomicrobium sp.]